MEVTVPQNLTAVNTCKGKGVSPQISWGNIPPGTTELAIFAMGVKPVDGKLYFAWAMAGVDPSLSGLKAGEVPRGAVLGRNSAGENTYFVCPKGSEAETYIFSVYAISGGLSPKQGFEPLGFREQATRASKEMGLSAATADG